MKTIYSLFVLFLLGICPLSSQVSEGGISMGQGANGQAGGLPISTREVPSDVGDVLEDAVKNNPQLKGQVDEFLKKKGLPPSDKIPLKDIEPLILKLIKNRDKRSQPVDPVQAGAVLIAAWQKANPGKPVPPEILNLKNEVACSSAAVILVMQRMLLLQP